jgi:enamine deaminase RidA (YjgF/YER057c/UK114 family)
MHNRFALTAALVAALVSTVSGHAQSDTVKRVGDSKSMFSSVVWVGDTAYLSGTMAPVDYQPDKAKGTPAGYNGDTKAQAIGAIKAIEKELKAVGLGLGDVVQMQAFLTGDPAKGDKMDLDGWNEAYRMFFGTPEQPNKPVRATVQVARLVLPTGRIEIMVIAARPRPAK